MVYLPGHLPYANQSGVLTADVDAPYWDATNRRLGIGTNTPSDPLHVSVAVDAFIRHTHTGMAGAPALLIGMNSGNNAALLQTTANKPFYLAHTPSGTYSLAAVYSGAGTVGYVGINKRAPTHPLDIISTEARNSAVAITHNVGAGLGNIGRFALEITGNMAATDETVGQTQGYGLVHLVNNYGLLSTEVGGPVYATGAAGGVGSSVYVKNTAPTIGGGPNIEEHSTYFGVLTAWTEAGSGDGGRYWYSDESLHGPVGLQPDAFAGRHLVSNNYFNGNPISNPSGNTWILTAPTAGASRSAAQLASPTYPMQVGLGIVGYSGDSHAPTRGFVYGLMIGNDLPGATNWTVSTSRFRYGAVIRDHDDTGLLVTSAHMAAGGTQIGVAIDASAGPLVVGSRARLSAGAADVGGNLYATGGVSTLGPASALGYWTAPATTVTASGNEITDAVRATSTSGDGRAAPDGSYGIWEATTNLGANPVFAADTTGWTAVGAALTRGATGAKFGAQAGKVVTNNAAANEGVYQAFAGSAATQYTITVWVRGVVNRNASGTVRIALYDDVAGKQASASVTLSDVPQAVCITATTGGGSATFRAYVETDVRQALTYYVCAMQIEAKPYATPLTLASRGAGRVQITAATAGLSPTQGWVIVAARAGVASASYTANPVVFDWRDGPSTNIISLDTQGNNTGLWRGTYKSGASGLVQIASPVTTAPGDIVVYIMQWRAGPSGLIAVSVNGAAFATAAHTITASGLPSTADLMNFQNVAGTHMWNGDVFYAAIGGGQLTNADAATIAAWGRNDPTLSHLAALNGGTAAPTYLWKANTTAANSALAVTNAAGHLDGSALDWSGGSAQTTVGAAGAASALPATPTGYLPIRYNNTDYVIPFYAKT